MARKNSKSCYHPQRWWVLSEWMNASEVGDKTQRLCWLFRCLWCNLCCSCICNIWRLWNSVHRRISVAVFLSAFTRWRPSLAMSWHSQQIHWVYSEGHRTLSSLILDFSLLVRPVHMCISVVCVKCGSLNLVNFMISGWRHPVLGFSVSACIHDHSESLWTRRLMNGLCEFHPIYNLCAQQSGA